MCSALINPRFANFYQKPFSGQKKILTFCWRQRQLFGCNTKKLVQIQSRLSKPSAIQYTYSTKQRPFNILGPKQSSLTFHMIVKAASVLTRAKFYNSRNQVIRHVHYLQTKYIKWPMAWLFSNAKMHLKSITNLLLSLNRIFDLPWMHLAITLLLDQRPFI